MTRPKVRVRAVMVVVAAVGLGFWGEQMRRRRAYCLEMAARHRSRIFLPSSRFSASRSPNRFAVVGLTAEEEEELRKTDPHPAGFFHWEQGFTTEDVEELRKRDPHAAWHLDLRDAYLRCARRPWEALPKEPTEPSHFPAAPGRGRAP